MAARTAESRVPRLPFEPLQQLPDGTSIHLALLGPTDRSDLLAGYESLSRRSRYLRFFSAMSDLPGPIADGLLETDDGNHVAIGARLVDPHGNVQPPIVGVVRYFRPSGVENTAEPSVAVIDELQGRGLGRLLLRMITRYARAHGVSKFRAHALADNDKIRRILRASNGVIVEREGPVVVYDVDVTPRATMVDEVPATLMGRVLRVLTGGRANAAARELNVVT